MYTWKRERGGRVPDGAVRAGYDDDGVTQLYVCRAQFEGGIHPGKLGAANKAYISHLGKAIEVNEYEVLIGEGHWAPSSGGGIPLGAVTCGYEANGEPLFVARADTHNKPEIRHPGKVRRQFGGAHIAHGTGEIEIKNYEVLIAN